MQVSIPTISWSERGSAWYSEYLYFPLTDVKVWNTYNGWRFALNGEQAYVNACADGTTNYFVMLAHTSKFPSAPNSNTATVIGVCQVA